MKYPQGTVGLGILSWRGHRSLDMAMASYQEAEFFSLFDEAMIFLPDPDDDVQKVAAKYPLRIENSPDNLGILVGMEEIANRLKTDYIFFTENDCPLLETRAEAQRQISIALKLLANDEACMARMRHVRNYGETFNIIDKYYRYFPEPDTMSAKLRRVLRPEKARRLSGAAIYGTAKPAQKFPKDIKFAGDGFHLVNTAVLPWTNQSILIRRDFFLDTILPYCKSVPLGRNINGFRSIEIELNRSKFWTHSGWQIACGPGLLTHQRAGDRGY
ncbi:MAG: hypothetical protein COA91_02985 [Robiginitomaculum sp.]|nr:MAG: hypothetical protein COA91_02985 [Robiginitomaculum sp.]